MPQKAQMREEDVKITPRRFESYFFPSRLSVQAVRMVGKGFACIKQGNRREILLVKINMGIRGPHGHSGPNDDFPLSACLGSGSWLAVVNFNLWPRARLTKSEGRFQR